MGSARGCVLGGALLCVLLIGCGAQRLFTVAIYVTPQQRARGDERVLVRGVQRVGRETGDVLVRYSVVEAGGGPLVWADELADLASQARYDTIVTIGSALGGVVDSVASRWEAQNFLALDTDPALRATRRSNVRAVYFNYGEIGFLAGYMGAFLIKGGGALLNAGVESGARVSFVSSAQHPDLQLEGAILLGAQAVLPLASVTLAPPYERERVHELVKGLAAAETQLIVAVGEAGVRIAVEARRYRIPVIMLNAPSKNRSPVYASLGVAWDQVAYEEMKLQVVSERVLGSVAQVGVREGYLSLFYPRWHYLRPIPREVYRASLEGVARLESGALYF